MASDPTYLRDKINANPTWAFAFRLSEIHNDSAPIGWSEYIGDAGALAAMGYTIESPGAELYTALREAEGGDP